MKRMVLVAVLLSGCSGASGVMTEKAALELVANSVRDPASVQFRNVHQCAEDSRIFTGEMNARDPQGAYIGFAPFYVDRGEVTVADERFLSFAEGRELADELERRCSGGG